MSKSLMSISGTNPDAYEFQPSQQFQAVPQAVIPTPDLSTATTMGNAALLGASASSGSGGNIWGASASSAGWKDFCSKCNTDATGHNFCGMCGKQQRNIPTSEPERVRHAAAQTIQRRRQSEGLLRSQYLNPHGLKAEDIIHLAPQQSLSAPMKESKGASAAASSAAPAEESISKEELQQMLQKCPSCAATHHGSARARSRKEIFRRKCLECKKKFNITKDKFEKHKYAVTKLGLKKKKIKGGYKKSRKKKRRKSRRKSYKKRKTRRKSRRKSHKKKKSRRKSRRKH